MSLIREVYKRRNPAKLGEVKGLLAKYKAPLQPSEDDVAEKIIYNTSSAFTFMIRLCTFFALVFAPFFWGVFAHENTTGVVSQVAPEFAMVRDKRKSFTRTFARSMAKGRGKVFGAEINNLAYIETY